MMLPPFDPPTTRGGKAELPLSLFPHKAGEKLLSPSTNSGGTKGGFFSIPIIFFAVLLFASLAQAQDMQIVAAEYRVDNLAPVEVALTPDDSVSFTVAAGLPALVPGFHNVVVRFRDLNGVWSVPKSRLFYVSPDSLNLPGEPYSLAPIVGAEISIDSGAAIPVALAADDSVSFAQTVLPGTLTVGFHHAVVRYQDSAGVWSVPKSRLFYVSPDSLNLPNEPYDLSPIAGAEAQIHGMLANDGIFDTTFALTAADGDFDSAEESTLDHLLTGYVLSLGVLPRGDYTLKVRFCDTRGVWTAPVARNFVVTSGLVIFPRLPNENDVTLTWFTSQLDVGYYSIYVSDSASGVFNFLDSTNVGTYIHANTMAESLRKFYQLTVHYLGAAILVTEQGVMPIEPSLVRKEELR